MSNRDRLLAAYQRKINECRSLEEENARLRDQLRPGASTAPQFLPPLGVDGNGRAGDEPRFSFWRWLFGGR